MKLSAQLCRLVTRFATVSLLAVSAIASTAIAGETKTLNVLFLGNSFTARHNLVQLINDMLASGGSGLHLNATQVIYGGSILRDHWEFNSQNFVRLAVLTPDEERATIKALESATKNDPKNKNLPRAVERHKEMLPTLNTPRPPWDLVVLESYQDDSQGEKSLFLDYARKFAALAKAQGAKVLLYETAPELQNEAPLIAPPDSAPVAAKEKIIAGLAHELGAKVVPMSSVALACHVARPDLTLRYKNDPHLNQVMAYLTACTFYAVLADRSPVGITIDAVTDTRPMDKQHRDQTEDGGPITRKFSEKERTQLQHMAWDGFQEFQKITSPTGKDLHD